VAILPLASPMFFRSISQGIFQLLMLSKMNLHSTAASGYNSRVDQNDVLQYNNLQRDIREVQRTLPIDSAQMPVRDAFHTLSDRGEPLVVTNMRGASLHVSFFSSLARKGKDAMNRSFV